MRMRELAQEGALKSSFFAESLQSEISNVVSYPAVNK
jgi:hypothetical protein